MIRKRNGSKSDLWNFESSLSDVMIRKRKWIKISKSQRPCQLNECVKLKLHRQHEHGHTGIGTTLLLTKLPPTKIQPLCVVLHSIHFPSHCIVLLLQTEKLRPKSVGGSSNRTTTTSSGDDSQAFIRYSPIQGLSKTCVKFIG